MNLEVGSLKNIVTQSSWRECITMAVVLVVTHSLYNLYFHPLAGFPGPLWARTSLLWRFWHTMRGRSHRDIQKMHEKYGPVFRVSPNELSFASVQSWKDIYGHPPAGSDPLLKGEFYDVLGAGYKEACIGTERDPSIHAKKKKHLTAAFSVKALAAQEPIVQKCIDDFVEKLGPLSEKSKTQGINVAKWLEMAAFDILGEMAFGEGFGCIETEVYHNWIDLILNHLWEVTLVDNIRRVQLLSTLCRWFLPSVIGAVKKEHSTYSRAKVQRRLDTKDARQDFLTNVVSKVRGGQVSQEELTAHASTLIIAGGETTATCLAAAIYYLLKTPAAMDSVMSEVRLRFEKYEDINATAAMQLPYVQAVIDEALRIHPPASLGFARVSPGCQVDGFWVPKGAEVYTSAFAVTHDAKYFHEPETFKPERWLDPECTDVKEASQPFSLGYRACIGRNFAYLEMSSFLCKMLFRYNLKLVDDELDWEAASRCHGLWWKAPVNVLFEERVLD